jgi:hypothetical protein
MANKLTLNRLEPTYYRVEIAGAIDCQTPEDYAAENGGSFPTTDLASLEIEYSNMWFEAVIRGASENISPLFHPAVVVTGRTNNAPATAIEFTLPYDRPEYLDTEDETAPPARLTGADALKRMIARALINDVVENRQVYQPEALKNEPQILELTAVALFADLATAEGAITITEIPNLID